MREKAGMLIIVLHLETSMGYIPAATLHVFSMIEVHDPNIRQMING